MQNIPKKDDFNQGSQIGKIIKYNRRKLSLTQQQFSMRVGVGLRFIRDLEQGKQNLQLNKLLQVLTFLGLELFVRSSKK
jgi:y4mF family transcriptional regulator